MLLATPLHEQVAVFILNGVATALLGLLIWLVRKAVKALHAMVEKVEHIDECMDRVRTASEADRAELRRHHEEAKVRDSEIADLKRDYAGLEGYMKGVAKLSIDASINEVKPKEMNT